MFIVTEYAALKVHADIFSRARDITFGQNLSTSILCVCSSEGSGKSRQCNKYKKSVLVEMF